MTKERALRLARKWAQGHVCTLREGEAREYHELVVSLLTQPSNDPLTLAEMQRIGREPVWVQCIKPGKYVVPPTGWKILERSIAGKFGVWDGENCLVERDYGTDWLAYRRPPEGEG